MEIKAFIFDMDGVILDTEYQYVIRLVNFSRYINQPITFEKASEIAGSSKEAHTKFLSDTFNQEPERIRRLFDEYKNRERINFSEHINIDAVNLVKHLKKKGFLLGVASSTKKQNLDIKIDESGLTGYFDVVIGKDMVNETKPNPEIYLKVLHLLGVKSEEAIAIEDSTVGIAAAKGAGLLTVAKYDPRVNHDISQADIIIQNLEKLIKII